MYRARLDYGLDTVDMSVPTMRRLTVFALVAFPVGAVIQEMWQSAPGFALLIGSLLMCGAILTGAALCATRAQKVAAGQDAPHDEYEQTLRREAMAGAFTVLSKLLLAALAYAYLAEELDLWLPSIPRDWTLMILGLGNLLMILPTAVLVWSGKLDDEPEEGG